MPARAMSSTTLPPSRYDPNPHPLKHLLATYTTSHPLRSPSPLPPSSRVDPKLSQRAPPGGNPFFWTLPTWFAFLRFIVAKGWHIVLALVWHFLFGPARKSWGYRMTFLHSFMRNVADHTSLADIVLIRRLISLHFLIPLPADAIVTPITFVVPRHEGAQVSRGFLRELDLAETGTRELTGEWVVGTDVWKRLKAERRARQERERRRKSGGTGGVEKGVPTWKGSGDGLGQDSPDVDTDEDVGLGRRGEGGGEKVIYYVHGGAYYVGNAATHRLITIGVSKACNARVFAITYRLAPEHAFPLPLHDVLHGYLRLLAPPLSIPPENIVIAGDSAGGGLSLALVMYLRDEGYQLPAGIVLMSPWVDLTMSCGSWDENADLDVVPRPSADDHLNPVGCYLGASGLTTYLTHPYASPLFGDLSNLPPMLIQSGDSEVLRDENTLLAHKATLAGGHITHELYEDMVHVFQMFTWLPAAEAAIKSVGRWVRTTLPKIQEERTRGGRMGGADMEINQPGVAKIVDREGEEVGEFPGRMQAMSDEINAAADLSSLRLDLHNFPAADEQPSIDVDSLPASHPSSGSVTPTRRSLISPASASPTLSRTNSHTASAPRLRRALTSFTAPPHSPPTSPPRAARRRRPTAPSRSMHATSPPMSPRSPDPVSPTPSIRRLGPATRARSQSHSDIFHLVEGYVEGGAANETVVYGAGGEVRSVGVLGEDDGFEEGQ